MSERFEWTLDAIRAEARRLKAGGGNPRNAHQDLQTALAMIEALALLVKPQEERDREAPKQYGQATGFWEGARCMWCEAAPGTHTPDCKRKVGISDGPTRIES